MDAPENNRSGTIGIRRLLTLTSERDRRILASVHEFRFMTTEHLCELHFVGHASHSAAHRACTRVLTRLHELKLIRRFDQRLGGFGGGSTPYVWMVDSAGDRLIRHLRGEEDRPRQRPFLPSQMFLEHTLAVTDTFMSLVRASRQGQFELLRVESEPANWRTFPGQLGAARILKPDLAVVTAQGDYEEHWFIEVDRGSEWTRVLMRKVHLYEDYRRSGAEKKRSGVSPRTLWLMPTPRRVQLLAEAIERDPRVNAKAFVVSEASGLLPVIRGEPPPWTKPAESEGSASDPARGSNN